MPKRDRMDKADTRRERRLSAMLLVNRCFLISAAVAFSTFPVLDVLAPGTVHIVRIKAITEYYSKAFSEQAARDILITIAATIVLTSIGSILGRKALRALPLVAQGFGLATMSASSAAVSYGLGLAFAPHVDTGSTLEGFEVENLHRSLSWIGRSATR